MAFNAIDIGCPLTPSLSCSNASSQASVWIECNTDGNLLEYIFTHLVPKSNKKQQSRKINCIFCDPLNKRHKMRTIYKICTATEDCQLEYKISLCEATNKHRVVFKNEHNHEVKDFYRNVYGVHSQIKEIIDDMISKKVDEPKVIHNYISSQYIKFNYFKEIPLPTLDQIQGYVCGNRSEDNRSNCIDSVAELILESYELKEDSNENDAFVFGLYYDSSCKPFVGDGKKIPLHIFMTSKKLLTLLDDRNQINGGMHMQR